MAEFIGNFAISTLASAGATFDPTVNLGPGRRTMADLYPKSAIAKLCSRVTTMTNFADRTIWTGVNLDILGGLNSASVDLIYSDPPFNSNRNYAAPVQSAAAGAAFKDTWTLPDPDVAWMRLIADQQPAMYQVLQAAGLNHGKGTHSYLCMMAVRLLEMRRVLKDTGSIHLHSPTRRCRTAKTSTSCSASRRAAATAAAASFTSASSR